MGRRGRAALRPGWWRPIRRRDVEERFFSGPFACFGRGWPFFHARGGRRSRGGAGARPEEVGAGRRSALAGRGGARSEEVATARRSALAGRGGARSEEVATARRSALAGRGGGAIGGGPDGEALGARGAGRGRARRRPGRRGARRARGGAGAAMPPPGRTPGADCRTMRLRALGPPECRYPGYRAFKPGPGRLVRPMRFAEPPTPPASAGIPPVRHGCRDGGPSPG
jgi:hypothetical protein